jgi:hypothetical protein
VETQQDVVQASDAQAEATGTAKAGDERAEGDLDGERPPSATLGCDAQIGCSASVVGGADMRWHP